MTERPLLVWFRQDLRLADNPALSAATERGAPIIPVFILADKDEGDWAPGAASRWWLHHSLESLDRELRRMGSRLVLRQGRLPETLVRLARDTAAQAVFWNRRYEPAGVLQEQLVQRALQDEGLESHGHNSALMIEPWNIATAQGHPFRVFTPFWRAFQDRGEPPRPLPLPRKLVTPPRWPASLPLGDLKLKPSIDWAAGLRRIWEPGEKGAFRRLAAFLDRGLAAYPTDRDRPDLPGISTLSPHLHFGEIGPRQIWEAVRGHETAGKDTGLTLGSSAYRRQLVWREFSYHLLFHFPHTPQRPLASAFEGFPWADDLPALEAWRAGRTGYPIVDAGMRQLWSTGWMHNRVRMVVSSFLVKDLLISWCEGARWFWDTLVDADLANNTFGWQWCAGCGADAAPFFRIFNPVIQGRKFDPRGTYVRRWIPELAGLPDQVLHAPWEASSGVLASAGVDLGKTYPRPMVDHAWARARALAAFSRIN